MNELAGCRICGLSIHTIVRTLNECKRLSAVVALFLNKEDVSFIVYWKQRKIHCS